MSVLFRSKLEMLTTKVSLLDVGKSRMMFVLI